MSRSTPLTSVLRRVIGIARRVYLPLALAFIGYAAWRAAAVLPDVVAHARPVLLLCAVMLWAVLHLVTPLFSWHALTGAGAAIGYRQALRIHVSRLPARYLPGGIWHTVSRVADFHAMGVGRNGLARLVLLENTVPLGVAAVLGGGCLSASGAFWPGCLLVACGAILLCAIPLVLRHRLLGATSLDARAYAALLLASTIFWLLAAAAFTCYWQAYPVAAAQAALLRVAGAYLVAWAAGFAAVFAPQGMGVFEAVAGWLLKGALPLAGTALVVAGFRVAVLAADALAFSVLATLRRTVPAVIDQPPNGRL